jgi:PEP-CTERM/exosortase A-associated glycosyltransferase
MKILHIFDHSLPAQSGYVYRSLGILKAQRNLGYETVHLTSSRQPNIDNAIQKLDEWLFYRTPAIKIKFPVLKQIVDMNALKKRIDELVKLENPQLIHVHSPVLNFFPAYKIAKKYGLPITYEIRAFWEDAAVDHGTTKENSLRYKVTKALETKACTLADHIYTICDGLKNDLATRGIPQNKITIIPNAVDVDSFLPIRTKNIDLLESLNLQDKIVLGFIGSFYAYEGLDTLIQAMPLMSQKNPNIRLLLVGGGPQENNLKKMIETLGLQKEVLFIGRVPHSDVQKYYSICDAMVFPRHSMRLTELVTPLKPLETMCMQKLVIASNIGGHRELIEDAKTGYLVDSTTKENLSANILNCLHKQNEWNSIIQNGYHHVKNIRNWNQSAKNYLPFYQKFNHTNLLNIKKEN